MRVSDAWYLAGPLVALALTGALAAVLRFSLGADRRARPETCGAGLALFRDEEDYGLLHPAALSDDAAVAAEVRRLLAAAGIRSTWAVRPDGQTVVLVFAEEVELARRLVGGSPERQ